MLSKRSVRVEGQKWATKADIRGLLQTPSSISPVFIPMAGEGAREVHPQSCARELCVMDGRGDSHYE